MEKLQQEQFYPTIEGDEWRIIKWIRDDEECFIYESDIDYQENKLAWFQSSDKDNHLLRVFEAEGPFQWTPITYNPVFGCRCLLLEWYQNQLLFIYQEKHDIYICAMEKRIVRYFNFHGEEIERKGSLIAYGTYSNRDPDKVKLIQIPELILLEPIAKNRAERMGLIPTGLNRPDGFLKLKEE